MTMTTCRNLFQKDTDRILVDQSYFNGEIAVVGESAVVKIQSGNCLHLSKNKEATVRNLLKNQDMRKGEGEKRK